MFIALLYFLGNDPKQFWGHKMNMMVALSHVLITLNCSCNFAIYCAKVIGVTAVGLMDSDKILELFQDRKFRTCFMKYLICGCDANTDCRDMAKRFFDATSNMKVRH